LISKFSSACSIMGFDSASISIYWIHILKKVLASKAFIIPLPYYYNLQGTLLCKIKFQLIGTLNWPDDKLQSNKSANWKFNIKFYKRALSQVIIIKKNRKLSQTITARTTNTRIISGTLFVLEKKNQSDTTWINRKP